MNAYASVRAVLVLLGDVLGGGMAGSPANAGLVPFDDVVDVAAGLAHSCAVTGAGAVYCWGSNEYGQLGDGSSMDRVTPVQVTGLDSGMQAVSVGRDHSCALSQGGAVWCWGRNSFGQLGDGTAVQRLSPVPVSNLSSGVQAIAVGGSFSCALNASGGVLCWGANSFGSLGDGSTNNRAVPGLVWGMGSGMRAISTGQAHACAIATSNGGLKCWGYNAGGQLGIGNTESQATPVNVSGLASGVATVATGVLHTCATLEGGWAAKCWGNNFLGQLGDGSNTNRLLPVDVVGLGSGVAAMAAGHYHSCARSGDGTVRCWGTHYNGQLGVGTETYSQTTAGPVPGLAGVTALAVGDYHGCAIVAGGALHCWGANSRGQTGIGDVSWPVFGRTPVDVVGLSSGVVALAAGGDHTCAKTSAGAVKCWGNNGSGQLGDGSSVRRFTPVSVIGLPAGSVQMLAPGNRHTCVLVGNTVRCWGDNSQGQLGVPATLEPHPPVNVVLSGNTTMIDAGSFHTCALNSAGRVSCWGISPFGYNGGTTTLADLVSGIRSVAAGGGHSCAVTTTGTVKCWGSNDGGQFGYYGSDSPYQTVLIEGLWPGTKKVSAGSRHSCAIDALDWVQCWGSSVYGQGGTPAPMALSGVNGVQSLGTGDLHNCVVIAGVVKCWGNNARGQIGDGGSSTPAYMPVEVAGLGSGVQAVAVGDFHVCALTATGGVKCWGDNEYGQMGDGRFPGVPVPQPVMLDPAFFRSGFEAGEDGQGR
ncbi:hypothetical protein [Denitratimonas sp. CY0512]|uniref:RCC1 domain-containing protein n=1 Tax=Denitratimonas sp. CY0512 TaxID=3131940 RepID=UPI00309F01FF